MVSPHRSHSSKRGSPPSKNGLWPILSGVNGETTWFSCVLSNPAQHCHTNAHVCIHANFCKYPQVQISMEQIYPVGSVSCQKVELHRSVHSHILTRLQIGADLYKLVQIGVKSKSCSSGTHNRGSHTSSRCTVQQHMRPDRIAARIPNVFSIII